MKHLKQTRNDLEQRLGALEKDLAAYEERVRRWRGGTKILVGTIIISLLIHLVFYLLSRAV